MFVTLNIDYEDGVQSTYKGIELSEGNKTLCRFDSGDIVIDYIDYLFWAAEQAVSHISYLSSWDHFFMDDDDYRIMYVDHSTAGNSVVTNFEHHPIMYIDKLTKYPVPKHITTFEQLKTYYRSKRPVNTTTN